MAVKMVDTAYYYFVKWSMITTTMDGEQSNQILKGYACIFMVNGDG